MRFFKKNIPQKPTGIAVQTARATDNGIDSVSFAHSNSSGETALYDGLRTSVPIIDAAITKIVRLVGGFKVTAIDEKYQHELDSFLNNVQVGLSGTTIHSFINGYLDSLLTYGNAVGEIILNENTLQVAGLYNGNVRDIIIKPGNSPIEPVYYVKTGEDSSKLTMLKNPQLILFSALNPLPNQPYGKSILCGLPAISSILMRIYQCIGQNFDRIGNVRYAVTYKPTDSSDKTFAKERAAQIAAEWSSGMQAAKYGEIRDFIAVGDVDIKVIGAENQIIDTNVPVRQILEQIIAKLSIPPFLLGLSWTTTERMSSQQADILTSELEYYRRILNPVIGKIATTFLRLIGSDSDIEVIWDNINLQDEVELADARLKNIQALEIEQRLDLNAN